MSGPSEKAVVAARKRFGEAMKAARKGAPRDPLPEALNATHEAALGLDRSVCLRDVVEFLQDLSHVGGVEHGAHEVARKFGGKA